MLAFTFGFATGCVGYKPAPVDLRSSAEQLATFRLDEETLRSELSRILPSTTTSWPITQWDRGELLAVAIVRNPRLAVARAQVKAALARQVTAAQMANPNLTLQSEYARHDQHPWLYGLSLNWLLPAAERRRLERELARVDTSNAHLQVLDEIWGQRHELIAALSDWEGARRRVVLLNRLVTEQDRLIRLEQDRVHAGEDPPTELMTLQQQRIETEQHQAETRTAADAAQSAVAHVLGMPVDLLDGMSFVWPDWGIPPAIGETIRRSVYEQALLSRTDLAIAVGEYSMAETNLRLAVARQYPQLTIGPGYYWDHGIAKFPLDVGFEVPVNRNRAEIAAARADREVAAKRMLALQAGIFSGIAAAERAEAVALEGVVSAERRWDNAKHQLDQGDLSLRLGASDAPEVVSEKILAVRAELEVLQMRAQLQRARNALEDVLHAPLSGPEVALSASLTPATAGGGS